MRLLLEFRLQAVGRDKGSPASGSLGEGVRNSG